jgi:uncharacterized protein (TIGR02246 family)
MRRVPVVIAGLCLLCACVRESTRPDPGAIAETRQAITERMDHYMVAARAVDAPAVAAFFATNGVLFEPGIQPIEGREAIRKFMASFPGVKVEIATVTPETIEVFGDTALYWGTYFEKLAFPGQPVSQQRGKFVIEWTREGNPGTWLIQRYYRIPLP